MVAKNVQLPLSGLIIDGQDLGELDEHLPVGLQTRGDNVLLWTVVAVSYRTELDAGDTSALEVDDIRSTVATDAHRVTVEVPGCHLAQRTHERVILRDVGWFV